METIHGAESWKIGNDRVTLWVTRRAGMMAPAEFDLGGRKVSPYSLSPWTPDEFDDQPDLLRVLRGDFFCLPFGPQGEAHYHGEPANLDWNEVEAGDDRIVIGMQASDSGASLEREISLRPGQTAIYHDHRISGLEGRWSYGNHPVLDASAAEPGAVRLSVSPFRWGSVFPGVFSDPEQQERQMLQGGARFEELSSVPMADGGSADLTRWPYGWKADDLVMMVSEEPDADHPFAWSAVVFEDHVWFSLKNPADFPATLFWLSDGGRDAAPWNGRHVGRVGIEEVCSHFCNGVDLSRQDLLADDGIPTSREFRADEKVSLRIIHGMAAVAPGFGAVTSITPSGDGRIVITGENGATVETAVDWSFVL